MLPTEIVPTEASSTIDRSSLADASPRSAHLVGVCGAGMKALAELLVARGCTVTGSDMQLSSATSEMLLRRGLRVHQGHHGRFLPENADVLVYSPAVGPKNPERLLAARRGTPQFSYSQMLGQLMHSKIGLSIAGTHGKSTTTAMTGAILSQAGLSPSVVVGAELRDAQRSGWAGSGPHFVVESCEYQRNFLDLAPQHAAILAIEPDHFDCFQNFDETIAAFAAFAQRVPKSGTLLISADCQASRSIGATVAASVETFSLNNGADWWAADLRPTKSGIRYRAFYQGEYFSEISLQVPGNHNVLNSLAAAALCHRVGAKPVDVREGLADFPGLRRRFEPRGSWRGVTLIDDYAHHPTEVRATLKAAREQFSGRRVWCVFQPHQVSRTRALLQEFSESFHDADRLLVAPVFAAREKVQQEPREASQELVDRIAALQQIGAADRLTTSKRGAATKRGVRLSPTLDHTLATLDDELRPGDVLITMGAGDIGQLHDAFTRRLQRDHHSR